MMKEYTQQSLEGFTMQASLVRLLVSGAMGQEREGMMRNGSHPPRNEAAPTRTNQQLVHDVQAILDELANTEERERGVPPQQRQSEGRNDNDDAAGE